MHYLSTTFGISKNYYGGESNQLAGIGQENRFLGDVYRGTLYLIIKEIEQKELGMKIYSKLAMKLAQIAAVAFVDDIDLITDGEYAEYKIQLILTIYNDLYLAIGGYIEDAKCKFFIWI